MKINHIYRDAEYRFFFFTGAVTFLLGQRNGQRIQNTKLTI